MVAARLAPVAWSWAIAKRFTRKIEDSERLSEATAGEKPGFHVAMNLSPSTRD
jgi:hypothetical protein